MSNTPDPFQRKVNARVGTLLLFLAGVFSVLIFLDRATSIDASFPGIWYRSRGLHLMVCVGLYIAAWLVLRNASDPPDDKKLNAATPTIRSVRMFTRHNCKLCERAAEVLARFGTRLPEVDVIHIEGNPQLEDEFGEWVPVIEIDGEIRFRGSVSESLLERMIEGKETQLRRLPGSDEGAT